MNFFTHKRYRLILLSIFVLWFLLLAISPHDRKDWALENLLVLCIVVMLAVTGRSFPLSRISYSLLFMFLCLHEVGAHYTYAEVPYDDWFTMIAGRDFNSLFGWERNHFDRLVHFSYGLLLAYPIRELYCRVAGGQGFWAYFLPLDVTMSTSMLFELFEWGAAEIFGGELGAAYLGSQGDIWDAHKDMGLASIGALIAMIVTAMINIYLQRDFAREWADSLRVKERRPMGEDEISRMWKAKRTSKKDNE